MFATVSHFYPRQAFAGKAGYLQEWSLYKTRLRWVAPRLALKCLTRVKMENTLAYYDMAKITAAKSFIVQAPVVNFIKLF